jgi:hypothetical protein
MQILQTKHAESTSYRSHPISNGLRYNFREPSRRIITISGPVDGSDDILDSHTDLITTRSVLQFTKDTLDRLLVGKTRSPFTEYRKKFLPGVDVRYGDLTGEVLEEIQLLENRSFRSCGENETAAVFGRRFLQQRPQGAEYDVAEAGTYWGPIEEELYFIHNNTGERTLVDN